MTFHVNPNGHDNNGRANMDSVSQLYLGIVATWTTLLAGGIVFLVYNRNLPFLRIRNLSLGIAAVCTLHVYWILAMLVYTMNGAWPCQVEFWIMSIYLPFGIALYQANSTVLRHVAGLQNRFNEGNIYITLRPNTKVHGWRQLVRKWSRMNVTERAMYGIGIGMSVQVSWIA